MGNESYLLRAMEESSRLHFAQMAVQQPPALLIPSFVGYWPLWVRRRNTGLWGGGDKDSPIYANN